jgi:hypothetical protein
MAGFNKMIVLAGVRDELDRATHNADKKFDAELASWQSRKASIENARDKVRRLISKLNDGDLTIKEKAELIYAANGRGYGSDGFTDTAKSDLPAIPQRNRTARERALTNVIAVVESHTEATISLADLRALGVLEFVKVSADAC